MQTESTIQPPDSLAPGVIHDRVSAHDDRGAGDPLKVSRRAIPAASPHRRNRVGALLAKLPSVIRGDRYMGNAHPPASRHAEATGNNDQVYRPGIPGQRDSGIGECEVAAAEHTKER
jgi:hypothetical protein